jgi:hypothetical protein
MIERQDNAAGSAGYANRSNPQIIKAKISIKARLSGNFNISENPTAGIYPNGGSLI